MGTRLEGRAKRRAPHSTEGRAAHRGRPGSTCRGQQGRRPAFQDRGDHRGRGPDTRGGASRDPNKPHVAGAGPPRGRHGERVRGSDLAPAYPCGGRKARKVAVPGLPRNFFFRPPRPFPIPPVLAPGHPPRNCCGCCRRGAADRGARGGPGGKEDSCGAARASAPRASQRPPFRFGLPRGWSRPPFVSRRLREGIRLGTSAARAERGPPHLSQPVRGCSRSGRGGPGLGDPCPAAPGPVRRLLRGRPRLSPTSRAAGVTSLPAPGLGLAQPLARMRPVSPGLSPPLRVQLLSRLEPCGPPLLH